MSSSVFASLCSRLSERFSGSITELEESDFPSLDIKPDFILSFLTYLREEEGFLMLTDLTGVHFPDTAQFCVVYHLHDLAKNFRLRLRVYLPEDKPQIASACSVYSGANFMERETYDFFGIIFEGHPNLKRILNCETMEYFPLRKEYTLEDALREDKDDDMFGR